MRQISRIVLILASLLSSSAACALGPQTGIYWNPTRPGTAIYVEAQGDTIFAVLYGYSDVDGGPEFFVSSGPFIDDIGTDFLPLVGLQPIQGFGSPLYRVPSGSCLTCAYTPIAASEQVGSLLMLFTARGGLYMMGTINGRGFPFAGSQFGLPMERYNFSLGGLGIPGLPFSQAPDMRGEWVFTDQTDRARAAWRFDFTTREDDVSLSTFAISDSMVFRDATRNAVLYCFTPDYSGLTPAQLQALPTPGCEVRQGDTTLFWTDEPAIDEWIGTLGPKPPRSANVLRGPNRVLGRRLSD